MQCSAIKNRIILPNICVQISYSSSFIKERGQIEADYAKNLRRLVKRYSPKEAPRPTEEEFSHIRGYKQVRKIKMDNCCF